MRQPRNQGNWVPPQPRWNRPNNRGFQNTPRNLTVNNQMAKRLSFPTPMPGGRKQQFYQQGKWLIPRATHDTDKQFAPYYEASLFHLTCLSFDYLS